MIGCGILLNRDDLYPLYVQIKRKIIEGINNGYYLDGSRLPSETELCKKYEVSRITIRRSLQDMVDTGYLIRKQGKGTFVKTRKIKRSLITVDGYTEYMKKIGKNPQRKIVEKQIKPCPPYVAERLLIPEGSNILELKRIMYLDGAPFGYHINSYPLVFFPGLEKEITDQISTHELLEGKYGCSLKRRSKILNVLLVGEEIANYLGCDVNDPVYQIDKIEFNQYNKPVYHSLLYYDVSRVSFIIEE